MPHANQAGQFRWFKLCIHVCARRHQRQHVDLLNLCKTLSGGWSIEASVAFRVSSCGTPELHRLCCSQRFTAGRG